MIERFDATSYAPAALSRRAAELLPAGRAADFNQAMMELGATVCRPRAPRCGDCPVRDGCATRAAGGPAPAPRRRGAERFEDSDRWARGRIVAALLAGAPLPAGLTAERRERALAALERDGLVVRVATDPSHFRSIDLLSGGDCVTILSAWTETPSSAATSRSAAAATTRRPSTATCGASPTSSRRCAAALPPRPRRRRWRPAPPSRCG